MTPARWLVPLGLLAGGGLLAARFWRGGGGAADVPSFTVAEVPFTRVVSADGVLKPVRTTVISAPSEGRDPLMIAWMVEDGDPVKKGDVVIRFDALEVSKRLADGQSDRAAADSRIEKEKTLSQTSLQERDRTATVTREEMDSNKALGKKDPRFFPRAEVIESEIDDGLFERRLEHARAARKVEEKLGRSRVDLAAIEQRKADLFQKQASATLRHLEIRAPHDGTFVLQRWGFRGTLHPGDRVFAGMRIAEISTSLQMDAEVFVLEADAGGLQAGQKATVVLEAQPDVAWPARVRRVDPFPKPRQPEVPAQYFATLLEIEGKTAGLRPGQRLHASITLDEQAKALVVPRQAVFRRDSDTIVYRQSGTRFEAAQVKLGAGTVGRLVIASGVSAGDRLALRDPALSADEAMASHGAGAGAPGGKR
jgi:HlyD family secretion protein